ncbi:MAG: ornithine cyclodeaminase [Pseudomonadota bacterium]
MSTAPQIGFEDAEGKLDWLALVAALEQGHQLPRAQIVDSFLYRGADTLLNRSAWIDGLGLAVKVATVFPGNQQQGLPGVHGAVNLLNDATGTLEAIIDFHLVTRWKTAGDSLLAALRLADPAARRILILGAGSVADSLIDAYGAGFPAARITLWNRTPARAQQLAAAHPGVSVADDLEAAVTAADIVSSATMTTTPLLRGDWLRPGQHVDLIGAYRPDMRETDDTALNRARIFVDSVETTLDHIGELKIPLAAGTLKREQIVADFYDLAAFTRELDDITLFKNGGGAHLDLMTGRYILDQCRPASE